ncbi:MAG: class I SAM-dependent methyltransferase, partial [Candidatus Eremiobacteraeota bacterium]|nr:class I SAM-dependent methyltransferase [Candidatus Eremiobacteraeota bacterium]
MNSLETVRPPHTEKGAFVRDMFARIAPRYDLTNRIMTAGMDERWRKRAIALLEPAPGSRILDLCCGTGDVTFHLLRTDPTLEVTGLDFCVPMLNGARARAQRDARGRATFVEGDVMALPFPDVAFEGATMG